MYMYKILFFLLLQILLIINSVNSLDIEKSENLTLSHNTNYNSSVKTNSSELLDSESRHRFHFEVSKVLQLHRPKTKNRNAHSSGKQKYRPGHSSNTYKHNSPKTSAKSKFKHQNFQSFPPRHLGNKNNHPFLPEFESYPDFHPESYKKPPHFPDFEGPGHVDIKREYFHPYSTISKNKHPSSDLRIENEFPITLNFESEFNSPKRKKKYPNYRKKQNKNHHGYRFKTGGWRPEPEDVPGNKRKRPLFPNYVASEHPLHKNTFKLDLEEFNPDDDSPVAFMSNDFFDKFHAGDKSAHQKFKSDIEANIHKFILTGDDHDNDEHDSDFEKHIPGVVEPPYLGSFKKRKPKPQEISLTDDHEDLEIFKTEFPKDKNILRPRPPKKEIIVLKSPKGPLRERKPEWQEYPKSRGHEYWETFKVGEQEDRRKFKSRVPKNREVFKTRKPKIYRPREHDDETEVYRTTEHEDEPEMFQRPDELEILKPRKPDDREIFKPRNPEDRKIFKPRNPEDPEIFRPRNPEEPEVFKSQNPEDPEIFKPRSPETPEIFRIREPENKKEKFRARIPEKTEIARFRKPEDPEIFKIPDPIGREVITPRIPEKWLLNSKVPPPRVRGLIKSEAPKPREIYLERAPREKFSKRYFNLFTSSFKPDVSQKRNHARLFDRHKSALNDVSNMCGKNSLYSGYNPQHKSAMNTLVQMYNDHTDLESLYEMSSFLKDQVHPQMWYAALMRAQLTHLPNLLSAERPNPIYLFPTRFFPADVLKDNGNKHSSELDCIPLDERFGEDNGIENRLWYFREDVQLNSHHWIWHLLYPFNSTMPIERRGEFFYFFHHELVARYIAERLSNDMPMPVSLNLQVDSTIEEGYNPHLVDGISTRAFAPRPPHLIFPGALNETGFEVLYNITIMRDRVIDILFTGTVFRGSKQIPIHTIDNINILGELSEASLQSINPEFYGTIGYHNQGHMFLGSLIGNSPLGTIGVIGDQATAMRDVIFYRWHKLVDTLFQTYKVTHLAPYSLTEGDYPLIFDGIKIMDLDVLSDNGGTLNHLHTYWESREFNLEGGLDFNSVNGTAPPNLKVCAKHLDHEEFVYHFRIECNRPKQVKSRIRLFLAPRYKSSNRHEQHRFTISEQRLLFFSLDSFVTILKPGSNILSRKSTDSALTAPWPPSIQQLRQDVESGTGKKSKCECGYPHHLLLPKGSEDGMVFDLFAMVTDASKETIHDEKPNLDECTPSHIHCGIAGKLYPDAYPMGYPFDRKPYTNSAAKNNHEEQGGPAKKKRNAGTKKDRKRRHDIDYDTREHLEDHLEANEEENPENEDSFPPEPIKEEEVHENDDHDNLDHEKDPPENEFDVNDLKSNVDLHDEHLRIFNNIIKNEQSHKFIKDERIPEEIIRSPPKKSGNKHFQYSSKESKVHEDEDDHDSEIHKELHSSNFRGSDIYRRDFSMLEDFVSQVPNMATTQIVISHRNEFGP